MNVSIVLRQVEENIVRGRWHFISLADAVAACQRWSKRLPRRYDLIVGCPRAGLFVASLLSNSLGTRLASPESLPSFWSPRIVTGPKVESILVVDDAITTGSVLKPARDRAKRLFPNAIVDMGSLYVDKDAISLDTYGEILPSHPLLEWDLLDLDPSMKIASDMDGVICSDCPKEMEPDFDLWIPTAKPYLVPSFGLFAIITSRNEYLRPLTEAWLKANKVQYKQLLMDPTPLGGKRDLIGNKVKAIYQVKPRLFIESNDHTAWRIHWRTGVPTLATETMRFFGD